MQPDAKVQTLMPIIAVVSVVGLVLLRLLVPQVALLPRVRRQARPRVLQVVLVHPLLARVVLRQALLQVAHLALEEMLVKQMKIVV